MIYDFENLNFQLLSVGNFLYKKGDFSVNPRPFASLSFRISGEGKFKTTADDEFVTKRNDILFIPAGLGYTVSYTVGESKVIHLKDCNYEKCENISVKNTAAVSSLFFDIFKNCENPKKHNFIKSQIYAVFQLLSDMTAKEVYDEIFEKCLSYINNSFCSKKITLSDICRVGNISEATLRRKFQRNIGMSPKQYILKKRLDKAITELTCNNDKTISEISDLCGFEDSKYFAKAVKKKYGIPPSAFRKIKNT